MEARYFVATKLFFLFLLTFFASVSGYYLLHPRAKLAFQEEEKWQKIFSPVQVESLRDFLEGTPPGEKREALLQGGKTYPLGTLLLEELNKGQKIWISSADSSQKAILLIRRPPIRIRNSSHITFSGIQFQSELSDLPLFVIENCQNIRFQNCQFVGGKKALEVLSCESISLRNCQLLPKKSGILIRKGQGILISQTKFQGQKQGSGIAIVENSSPVLLERIQVSHFSTGVEVIKGKVHLFSSLLTENSIGLSLKERGGGKIGQKGGGNQIRSNQRHGIVIKNSHPFVGFNQIGQNKRYGILIYGNSGGEIKHNQIFGNQVGIVVRNQSVPTILQNKIFRNKDYGISVQDRASGAILENEILENGEAGIFLFQCRETLEVEKNKIWRNGGVGIYLSEVPKSLREKLENNDFGKEKEKNKYGRIGPP